MKVFSTVRMALYKIEKFRKCYPGYPHWDERAQTECWERKGTKWVGSFKKYFIAN